MNPPTEQRAPADNERRKADLAVAPGPAFRVYKQVNYKSVISIDSEVKRMSWVCLINQFPECYLDSRANDIDHPLPTGDSQCLLAEVINSSLILKTNNERNQISVEVSLSGLYFRALMTVVTKSHSSEQKPH